MEKSIREILDGDALCEAMREGRSCLLDRLS